MKKIKWGILSLLLASMALLQGCYAPPPEHHATVVVKPIRHYHGNIGYHTHAHRYPHQHKRNKTVIIKPHNKVIIKHPRHRHHGKHHHHPRYHY